MEGDALGQVADVAAQREAVGGRVGAEKLDAARGRAGEAEHHLDLGGLAGAVVADERDHLAGVQREVEVAHGGDRAVALGDAVQGDGVSVMGCTSSAGAISGALSRTPPGSVAGKRDCAQRITWTAGLVTSRRACGRGPHHPVDDVVRAVGGVGDAVAVEVEGGVVGPVVAAAVRGPVEVCGCRRTSPGSGCR